MECLALPFSMTTIPQMQYGRGRAEIVRKVSRQQYGRPAAKVDAEIAGLIVQERGGQMAAKKAATVMSA